MRLLEIDDASVASTDTVSLIPALPGDEDSFLDFSKGVQVIENVKAVEGIM